jgi:TRAP-type C4-dicarboxylate transport system substrate-binding protein
MRNHVAFATLVAVITVACAGLGTPADKGGAPDPRTLTILVGDRTEQPADAVARRFAVEVARASHGQLKIDVRTTTSAEIPPDYGTALIGAARRGEGDGVAVMARSWRGASVTSLEPLELPLLVPGNEAADTIAADPVAQDLLSGIRSVAGMEPLALIPTSLRVIESYADPVTTPAQLTGLRLRAWAGGPTFDALTVAGARPRWVGGFAFEQAARSGDLDGAVAVTRAAAAVNTGTFTYNVPLALDAVTLAITARAWNDLNQTERAILRTAGRRSRDGWRIARSTLGEDAADACLRGDGVALAEPAALDAFRAAFAPAEKAVSVHGNNAGTIARLRSIARRHPPATFATCGMATRTNGIGRGIGDQTLIDGSWRRYVSREEWARLGIPMSDWPTNGGLHTLSFSAGRWNDHDVVEGTPPDAGGPFVLRDGRLYASLDVDGEVLLDGVRFVTSGDELVLSGAGAGAGDPILQMWNGRWTRVS